MCEKSSSLVLLKVRLSDPANVPLHHGNDIAVGTQLRQDLLWDAHDIDSFLPFQLTRFSPVFCTFMLMALTKSLLANIMLMT